MLIFKEEFYVRVNINDEFYFVRWYLNIILEYVGIECIFI